MGCFLDFFGGERAVSLMFICDVLKDVSKTFVKEFLINSTNGFCVLHQMTNLDLGFPTILYIFMISDGEFLDSFQINTRSIHI